ncbi:MAG: BON domain-containing protein [Beijerinckiaceae bacterium]|nr:BON domain-containing protein [Beijerinckiaceae bacterium]
MAHEEDRRWRERNWREGNERRESDASNRSNERYRRDDAASKRFGENRGEGMDQSSRSWEMSGGRNRDRGDYMSESSGADQGRDRDDQHRWGERSGSNWEQTSWSDLERNRAREHSGDHERHYSGRDMNRGFGQGGGNDHRQDRDFGGSMRSGDSGAGRSSPYSGSSRGSSGRSGMGYGGGHMESQGRSGRDQDYSGNRSGYGGGGAGSMGQGYGYGGPRDWGPGSREDERGFWDKATDEVSSWFGDEEAERRREMDRRHTGLGPRNYARSDTRINEDVCDRLTEHPMVDASDIEVAVSEREVTLSGTVSTRDEKRRAEDIAEAVSGVSHVQNNLRVKQQGESAAKSTLDSFAKATSGAFGERGGSTMSSRSDPATGAAGAASSNPGDTPPKTTTGSSPGVMRADPSTSPTKGL